MRSTRKPAGMLRGVHVLGVIALEAAAVAAILWLVAARAEVAQSPAHDGGATLRIGSPD